MSVISNGYNKLYKESKDVSIENVNIYVDLDTKTGIIKLKSIMVFLFLFLFFESILNLFMPLHFNLISLPQSWNYNFSLWKLILTAFVIKSSNFSINTFYSL